MLCNFLGPMREVICFCCNENTTHLQTLLSGSEIQISYEKQDGEIQRSNGVGRNENICTLCEEYAAQALDYLDQNKTQTEIIEILHQSCSKLHSFKPQAQTFLLDLIISLKLCELK